MNRPMVLVADPTFETSKIREHANVLQFVNPFEAEGLPFSGEMLRQWVEQHIPKATVLYLRAPLKVDAPLLDKAKQLKAVVTISAGHDNIDSIECKKRGIPVGFAGSALTEVTAELCIGLLLSVSRRIPEAVEAAKKGNWPPNWHPSFMRGKAVEGAVVGIFGLGRIGGNVARKLRMFQPSEIIFHNRRRETAEIDGGDNESNFCYVSFEELLHQSDFLVITVSASAESQNRFGWTEFCAMKNDAILVNVSRGSIVNTDDLVRALEEGQIGGAGLDVTSPEPLPPSHPLFSMPNCVITPHIGSSTEVARSRMLALGESNVIAALQGRKMPSTI